MTTAINSVVDDGYKFGFHDDEKPVFKSERGLTPELVERISKMKGEPEWMTEFRLKALGFFRSHPNPNWANGQLDNMDYENIFYSPVERSTFRCKTPHYTIYPLYILQSSNLYLFIPNHVSSKWVEMMLDQ